MSRATDSAPPIGILCALPEELRRLHEALTSSASRETPSLTATQGVLDGIPVVLAECGVGKTSAAMSATLLAERYGCEALVLSGVAGGLATDASIGEIVVADRIVDVDYGRLTDDGIINYRPGTLPLPGIAPDPGVVLAPPLRASIERRLRDLDPPVRVGTVLSGDAFLASSVRRDELAERWSAIAIEMEGSAICEVAERLGIPWLIVRALSDRAAEDSRTDYEAFLELAAERAATVLRALLPVLVTAEPPD